MKLHELSDILLSGMVDSCPCWNLDKDKDVSKIEVFDYVNLPFHRLAVSGDWPLGYMIAFPIHTILTQGEVLLP